MERIIEYMIPSDLPSVTGSITIKEYLKSRGYSAQSIKLLKLSPEGLQINHQPALINAPIQPGDLLTVRIREEASSEKIVPVKLPLSIAYEDEDLFVIDKPAGMPIHPSQNNFHNSLANALAWHYEKIGEPFVFRCINRLDKDTSGLTVVAKHAVSAGILGAMICSRETFTREYLAIVKGSLTPPEGIITAPIARKKDSIIERQVDFEHGERAVTHYRLLRQRNGHSLVSLTLETGRTHQIRVHMKYIGFPLIGDHIYNPDLEHISRQALHAHRLCFTHPVTGAPLEFISPLPADMAVILDM